MVLMGDRLHFSPTRLACGVLTVTKGYRLGLAEMAVSPSPRDHFPCLLTLSSPDPGWGHAGIIFTVMASLVLGLWKMVLGLESFVLVPWSSALALWFLGHTEVTTLDLEPHMGHKMNGK